MGPFAAFGKFLRDLVMDVRLSVQKANEVSISHGQPPFCRLPRDQVLIMGDAGLSHETLSPPELWLRPYSGVRCVIAGNGHCRHKYCKIKALGGRVQGRAR
jgi:hypothetical protein